VIVSHDRTISRQVDRVVGIRDGMLASETIRHNQAPRDAEAEAVHEDDDDHHYRELVVLDNAGRVHIPQEFLEQFHIQGRAQLEVTEEGILIRQAEQTQTEQVRVEDDGAGGGMKRLGHTGVHAVKRVADKPKGIGRFFGGFGRKKK
jgi:bifunctional DNA-binding transcriptional regulator/antitoxin component of YhaV-PrlF toxin-antitoxin module